MSFKAEHGREETIASRGGVTRASAPLFADFLRQGAKPRAEWRGGVELELIGYERGSLERINSSEVQAVLNGFAGEARENLVFENDVLVEARTGAGGRITVEPGGQIEFSSAPHHDLVEVEGEISSFFSRLREIAEERHIMFLAVGFDPLRKIDEQRWFPKKRFELMRPYLGARGRRAWDMMCRTGAAQANLDYGSEEDASRKFALGNRLAPIINAIFANSPFENGKASGYKSTRSAVWLETDPERTGIPLPALGDDFSFQSFVAYALDVPMMFARRGDEYFDVGGISFGQFLEDARFQPVFEDWPEHLSTLFTEARFKQYIEVRSADAGDLSSVMAFQALLKGLMYDEATLDEALRVIPILSSNEYLVLQDEVARRGLEARDSSGINVLQVAKNTIRLATHGLHKIAPDEVHYLDVLNERVMREESSPADILLKNWSGSWHNSIEKLTQHLRIA